MPDYRRLQQYALAISVISILYNGAEGGVSVGLGAEASSRSLVFFGVQSAIEVISACVVVWRFSSVAKPGEDRAKKLTPRELKIEKYASGSIGVLLLCLALSTEAIAIYGLAKHQEPDSSNASLIISVSALVIMILIWLPKRYLARALDSSVMQGEATCSLSCIQITVVLFVGSLVFRLWKGGWWVDSATSLVLGLLFAKQGYEMINWVRDPEFDGGCCKTCKTDEGAAEMGERYRDLCECCEEKPECKGAGECQCPPSPSDGSSQHSCCAPRADLEDSKCCSHKVVSGRSPNNASKTPAKTVKECGQDACCSGPNSTSKAPAKTVEDCGQDSCCSRIDREPETPAKIVKECGQDACCSGPKSTSKTPAKTAKECGQDSCCSRIDREPETRTEILTSCGQDACCSGINGEPTINTSETRAKIVKECGQDTCCSGVTA